MEELNLLLQTTKEQMEESLEHLERAFVKLRAGKASASMVASVRVDYYGNSTPLTQVANIGTPDAMTLSIQPWEKNMISEIEKAIINSNLGFAPSNNGENIIINIPPLTEERRKELAKIAKSETENAKVSIRNARKDANTAIKMVKDMPEDVQKNYEIEIQVLTDKYVKSSDEYYNKKEEEIMKI